MQAYQIRRTVFEYPKMANSFKFVSDYCTFAKHSMQCAARYSSDKSCIHVHMPNLQRYPIITDHATKSRRTFCMASNNDGQQILLKNQSLLTKKQQSMSDYIHRLYSLDYEADPTKAGRLATFLRRQQQALDSIKNIMYKITFNKISCTMSPTSTPVATSILSSNTPPSIRVSIATGFH